MKRHSIRWGCVGIWIVASLLLSACGASTTTQGHATATVAPTATPSPSPATGASICPGLAAIIQLAQAGQSKLGFAMSFGNTTIKGTLMAESADSALAGSGFFTGPNNDPAQIRLVMTATAIAITLTDTHTQQATDYAVTSCAAKSDTDLTLSGATPAAFVADLLRTP